MEQIEIIIKDIKVDQSESFLHEDLVFDKKDIISSHFFEDGKDLEYQDIKSLKGYLQTPGTCNLYLKKAKMGTVLEDVFIIIASDGALADITINFSGEHFGMCEDQRNRSLSLLRSLVQISKRRELEKVVLGYEPAEDGDMKILEVTQGQVRSSAQNAGDDILVKNSKDLLRSDLV